MVVFVDLEGDEDELQDLEHGLPREVLSSHHLKKLKIRHGPFKGLSADDEDIDERREDTPSPVLERQNLNVNAFSAALSCYPVVSSLARHLDLNDLHALARTCRQFRCNLLQFRRQLLTQSLHCTNEAQPLLAELMCPDVNDLETVADLASLFEAVNSEFDFTCLDQRQLTGKIGKCARDLVAECRRCGTVVCRNCAIKPPSNSLLRGRHRRLCATCKKAPLWMHTAPTGTPCPQYHVQGEIGTTPSSSSSVLPFGASAPSSCIPSLTGLASHGRQVPTIARAPTDTAFAALAFAHDPCTCATRGVHLCQTCGQSLRSADTTYQRVWTWRSRYSTHIGGLGTGMGEGEQGQKCGRGKQCLDVVESEVEIDCPEQPAPAPAPATSSTAPLPSLASSSSSTSTSSSSSSSSSTGLQSTDVAAAATTPPKGESDHDLSLSAGYHRQEVEGIGGVVKKRVRKPVRIGATVCEYDDERSSGRYLEREATGRDRSWCGWCDRIVLEGV